MKNITIETLRCLLNYDPDTGIFCWRVQPSRNVKAGVVAGTVNHDGYIRIKIDGTLFMAHRLAWLYVYGAWPQDQIDHINGDKRDNRIANLRDVSRSVNMQNQVRAQKDNKSGLRGVSWNKNKKRWEAGISVNGRNEYLGSFDTTEAAHAAYLAAKLRLHPGDIRNLARLSS